MELAIHNRGRGPEIKGSRITVYDVLAESQAGATPEEMAGWWQLEVAQIQLALKYIEDHKEEVLRDWAAIKARHARGNPPHIQKLLEGSRAKLMALREELRRKKHQEENGNAGTVGGHQCPGTGGNPGENSQEP